MLEVSNTLALAVRARDRGQGRQNEFLLLTPSILGRSLMAQDAMKVLTADDVVWKEHPLFKGAQIP
jgi:hypothetical protein